VPARAASSVRTWILPRVHESSFERSGLSKTGVIRDLASLLRRTLQRIRTITKEFAMEAYFTEHAAWLEQSWLLEDTREDYHWHFEILPIPARRRSRIPSKRYYSPVTSETAVKRLRDAKIDSDRHNCSPK
jgi:hypothetical protein